MAYHGGQTSLPRAHRPRAPIMSVPAPRTAPLAPLGSSTQQSPPPASSSSTHHLQQQQQQPLQAAATAASSTLQQQQSSLNQAQVSLISPRPDSERTSNEYVETPFRVTHASVLVPASPPPLPRVRPARLAIPTPTPPTLLLPPPLGSSGLHPVTKQPTTSSTVTFSKDQHHLSAAECNSRQSIICAECNNCRCEACQQPRPLPECWMCDKKYFCSADTVIDYVSCLCCVKGLFYHCSESDGGGDESCADYPCSCGPERRTARWGCLAALSCMLPCLLLYWPLQCGKRAAGACYARHSRQGCRCRPARNHSSTSTTVNLNTPEKRLLDCTSDF